MTVPPSYRRRVEEDVEGGDLPVSNDNDIEPSVARWFTGRPGAPCQAPAVLNSLRRAMRRVDETRMTGAQLAGDLIQRRMADIAADREKNRTVFGVELFDGGASACRVALAEDLLEIAQQQRFDDIRHDDALSKNAALGHSALTLIRRDASDLRLAAVDEEFGAGDETGVVGRQEGNCLGDLFRIGDTTDRHLGRHVVEKALLLGGVGTGEAD